MFFKYSNVITFLFILLLIPSSAYSDQHNGAAPAYSAKLLVLGDSLSAAYGLKQQQGWVSLLQNKWYNEQIPIEIVNAAVSGETTDGGLARLPRLLEQHAPTHVLLELGGNDGLQGHNINKVKTNLSAMVELAQNAGAEVYLQEMQIPTNYGRRYTQMFTNSFDEIASQYHIEKIPFFLEDIALKPELMQNDGIHPNLEAQPMIAEFMYNALTPLVLDQVTLSQ